MYRFWRQKNIIIKRVITGVTLNKVAIYQENIFVLDKKLIHLAKLETGKKNRVWQVILQKNFLKKRNKQYNNFVI